MYDADCVSGCASILLHSAENVPLTLRYLRQTIDNVRITVDFWLLDDILGDDNFVGVTLPRSLPKFPHTPFDQNIVSATL